MATISKGYTFSAAEQVTAAKLSSLVDSATITGIVNADIDASAGIVDTKLAQIATAGKVNTTAITGTLGVANGGTGSATKNFVDLTTDQTVAGNKTFSAFPITPSAAPDANYEVANKKYTDDTVSTAINVAWAAWTPDFVWTTANPTLGTGVYRYVTLGKLVFFYVYIPMTDGKGCTGITSMTLPVAVKDVNSYVTCATNCLVNTTNSVGMTTVDALDTLKLTSTVTPTFTNGQVGNIIISGFYEIA